MRDDFWGRGEGDGKGGGVGGRTTGEFGRAGRREVGSRVTLGRVLVGFGPFLLAFGLEGVSEWKEGGEELRLTGSELDAEGLISFRCSVGGLLLVDLHG